MDPICLSFWQSAWCCFGVWTVFSPFCMGKTVMSLLIDLRTFLPSHIVYCWIWFCVQGSTDIASQLYHNIWRPSIYMITLPASSQRGWYWSLISNGKWFDICKISLSWCMSNLPIIVFNYFCTPVRWVEETPVLRIDSDYGLYDLVVDFCSFFLLL